METPSLYNLIESRINELVSDVTNPLIGLGDLRAYLDAIEHPNSINDRLLLLEKALVLLSRLGDNSASPKHKKIAADLQGFVIDLLYKDLPHPPSGYLALAASSDSSSTKTTAAPTASVPGTYVNYAYRSADGSNYNPLLPTLGKAGMPYARTVPSSHLTNLKSLPDPGLVFDTLLRRPKTGGPDGDGFTPHPAGVSSLFFAFADLIIHCIFNTNHTDITINDTSSYLDLSILYGNNQEQVDSVRRKDGTGMLWEDVFADNRLLLMPPSSCALLVLFCRNHNYIAQKLLAINEWGNFKDPASLASQPDKLAAQDDEIFHRSRLVNSGYFVKVILADYIGTVLGQARDGRTWRLDPLAEVRQLSHAWVPRGEGNVVSLEFNLLYRWHAALSRQDTEWTEQMFRDALKSIGKEDLPFDQLDPQTFFAAAGKALGQTGDVRTWTFGGLTRSTETHRFSDSDLAKLLQDATSYSAASFGARRIPEVLRVIEILGIEHARGWGACSLNEFRKFIGLEAYSTFEEWNPDKEIAAAARSLYKHIDNLELHVGMQAEATKTPGPGAGLCPGYTISRAILPDAAILTRGDRFLTTDFTPFNLTTWGYYDCQYPTTLHPSQNNPDGSFGGMLTKLLFRHLPMYYPARSAYAHFPFLVPDFLKKELKARIGEQGVQEYVWTRPADPGLSGNEGEGYVVKSYAGARDVLEIGTNKKQDHVWESGYARRLATVVSVGKSGQIPEHTMAESLIDAKTSQWAAYFYRTTKALFEEKSIKHVGSSQGTKYLDIVSDVIKVLPVRWMCNELACLPLSSKESYSEAEYVAMMEDVCRYVYLNVTPENDWQLRQNSVQFFRFFEKRVADKLNTMSSYIANTASQMLNMFSGQNTDFLKSLHAKADGKSNSELAAALFCEVVPTAAHWAKSVALVVDYYLGDSEDVKKEREEIVNLGKEGMEEGAKKRVVELIKKVLVADPPVSGTYRTALKDVIIPGPGGKRVEAGERVFVSLIDANNDRPKDAPGILNIGEDGLLSAKFFEAVTPVVLATILSLPNLQRAPGESGKFNKFTETINGAPEEIFIDAHGGLSPFPASLVVSYTTA